MAAALIFPAGLAAEDDGSRLDSLRRPGMLAAVISADLNRD